MNSLGTMALQPESETKYPALRDNSNNKTILIIIK